MKSLFITNTFLSHLLIPLYRAKVGFLLDSITRVSKTANLDYLELRHALSSL